MTRYRKLHSALAAALKGEAVDLDRLRDDDRVLIETVQANRVALDALASEAAKASEDYRAQSYVVEVLGERLHGAMYGREAAQA